MFCCLAYACAIFGYLCQILSNKNVFQSVAQFEGILIMITFIVICGMVLLNELTTNSNVVPAAIIFSSWFVFTVFVTAIAAIVGLCFVCKYVLEKVMVTLMKLNGDSNELICTFTSQIMIFVVARQAQHFVKYMSG